MEPPSSNFQQYSGNHPVNINLEDSITTNYNSDEQSGESEEVDEKGDLKGDEHKEDDEIRGDGTRREIQKNNEHVLKTKKKKQVNAVDVDKQPTNRKKGKRGKHQRVKGKLARRQSQKKKKRQRNKKSKKMRKDTHQLMTPLNLKLENEAKKRKHDEKPTKTNKPENNKKTRQKTQLCSKDLSGLVCRLAANKANCLTNSIYKKLCCKSCSKFINM